MNIDVNPFKSEYVHYTDTEEHKDELIQQAVDDGKEACYVGYGTGELNSDYQPSPIKDSDYYMRYCNSDDYDYLKDYRLVWGYGIGIVEVDVIINADTGEHLAEGTEACDAYVAPEGVNYKRGIWLRFTGTRNNRPNNIQEVVLPKEIISIKNLTLALTLNNNTIKGFNSENIITWENAFKNTNCVYDTYKYDLSSTVNMKALFNNATANLSKVTWFNAKKDIDVTNCFYNVKGFSTPIINIDTYLKGENFILSNDSLAKNISFNNVKFIIGSNFIRINRTNNDTVEFNNCSALTEENVSNALDNFYNINIDYSNLLNSDSFYLLTNTNFIDNNINIDISTALNASIYGIINFNNLIFNSELNLNVIVNENETYIKFIQLFINYLTTNGLFNINIVNTFNHGDVNNLFSGTNFITGQQNIKIIGTFSGANIINKLNLIKPENVNITYICSTINDNANSYYKNCTVLCFDEFNENINSIINNINIVGTANYNIFSCINAIKYKKFNIELPLQEINNKYYLFNYAIINCNLYGDYIEKNNYESYNCTAIKINNTPDFNFKLYNSIDYIYTNGNIEMNLATENYSNCFIDKVNNFYINVPSGKIDIYSNIIYIVNDIINSIIINTDTGNEMYYITGSSRYRDTNYLKDVIGTDNIIFNKDKQYNIIINGSVYYLPVVFTYNENDLNLDSISSNATDKCIYKPNLIITPPTNAQYSHIYGHIDRKISDFQKYKNLNPYAYGISDIHKNWLIDRFIGVNYINDTNETNPIIRGELMYTYNDLSIIHFKGDVTAYISDDEDAKNLSPNIIESETPYIYEVNNTELTLKDTYVSDLPVANGVFPNLHTLNYYGKNKSNGSTNFLCVNDKVHTEDKLINFNLYDYYNVGGLKYNCDLSYCNNLSIDSVKNLVNVLLSNNTVYINEIVYQKLDNTIIESFINKNITLVSVKNE